MDHLLPLAEAWDSGASAWTAKEREAYNLDDPRALIAVSAASNRSKSDKDPTQWLPPYAGCRCTYLNAPLPEGLCWRIGCSGGQFQSKAGEAADVGGA
ncbi:HNH endonuclease, partial [Streptomyces sp. NPDC002758]